MTLAVNLRKMLHRKSAEFCAPLAAGNTIAGGFVVSDKSDMIPSHDIAYYIGGVSAIWNYNADNDGWMQMPNSGIAGTFAAGSCGEFRAISAPGGNITNTATAGTTSSVTTGLTLTRDLAGYAFRVIAGAGAGYVGVIKGNTLGANAIITVETPNGVAFGATTQFQFFGGSLWFFNAGTVAVGFAVYDRATNVWTQRSVTGLPTAWGTDAQLVSTPGLSFNGGLGFVNGTATAGAASTITLEADKTFLLNQWANFQVRIIGGTGAGQIRTVASNTAGASPVVTVSAAWTTAPDATSVYRIEGNDDHFYLLGNNAVTMYRYSISGNAWTTLAPTAARAGAAGAGMTADWIDGVQATEWNDGSYGNHYLTSIVHQNGRYLYCLRGAAGNVLDVYDIAANTWISGVVYGQQMETFTAGTCSIDLDGYIYIQKESTGRIYRFDVAKNVLEPFVLNPLPQGAVLAGDKMFMTTFKEGGTKLNYLYTLPHTRAELVRWVVI
jgi:hypothetical protein